MSADRIWRLLASAELQRSGNALGTCEASRPAINRSAAFLVYLTLISGTPQRTQFGMYRTKWSNEADGTEYRLSHGGWIRLLRANGFDIEDLIEVQAPTDAKSPVYYDLVTAEWGLQWPTEETWVARKRVWLSWTVSRPREIAVGGTSARRECRSRSCRFLLSSRRQPAGLS